jgi:sortase A
MVVAGLFCLLGYSLFGLNSPALTAALTEEVLDPIPVEQPLKAPAPEEKPLKASAPPEEKPLKAPAPPEEKRLKLTIPKMKRVEDVPVYTAPIGEEEPLLRKGAVHLRGTDFPWQREAHVYILGHRQGYPGTPSHLLFRDLTKLHNGDEVFLIDANGTRYTYEVYREFVAEPYEVQVTQPIPGKSVVSLQSCTLPEYSKRLIVRAELKDVS